MLAHDLLGVLGARALGAQEGHLALERAGVERAADELEELVLLEGLCQVVKGPELHRGHRGAHRLHRGDQDHLHAVVDRLHPLEDLDAVHVGQADVEQDEVHLGGAQGVERLRAVGDVEHVVVVLKDQPE